MSGETEQNPVGEDQAMVSQQPETVPVAELNALKAKNQELIAERRKDRDTVATIRAELDAIKEKTTAQKQSELVEQGKYQELWKQQSAELSKLQEQNAELQKQLAEKDGAMTKERIRAAAVAAFSQNGVQAPDHLFKLLGADMKLADDGSVAVLTSSGEVPLTDHVANLKAPGSGLLIISSVDREPRGWGPCLHPLRPVVSRIPIHRETCLKPSAWKWRIQPLPNA